MRSPVAQNGGYNMVLLVRTLRFIANFLSYLIILGAVVAGMAVIEAGYFWLGLSIAVGGLIGTAVLFGMIAVQFEICDHLAAIRKHFEGAGSGPWTRETGDRLEPRFGG